MYGPVSKNGPALEFGEIGEEVKEEVRRQVIGKIVERARGKLKARDEREYEALKQGSKPKRKATVAKTMT